MSGVSCRGRGRRGLLAGAVVGGGYGSCYPSSSLPLLPVFSSRGRRVLSSYTPLGSIGLTPGSIGLTLVLSGSIPGVLGDQSKIFGPRTWVGYSCLGGVQLLLYKHPAALGRGGLALLLCSYCSLHSLAYYFSTMAENSLSVTTVEFF